MRRGRGTRPACLRRGRSRDALKHQIKLNKSRDAPADDDADLGRPDRDEGPQMCCQTAFHWHPTRAKRAPSPAAVWQSHEQNRPLARLSGVFARFFRPGTWLFCYRQVDATNRSPASSDVNVGVFVQLWLPSGNVPDFSPDGRLHPTLSMSPSRRARFGAFRLTLCRSAR
jgi:hypothetical protein